jgi:hypothetical protein
MSHHDFLRMVRCLSLALGCCLLAAGADARDVWRVGDQAAPVVPASTAHRFEFQADQPAEVVERGVSEDDDAVLSPSDEVGMSPGVDYGVSQDPWLASGGTGRWWGEADYLVFRTSGNPVPALVSTNRTVPPRNQAGVLGVGDTTVLLGNDRLDTGNRSGVALTLGHWFDPSQDWGVQATWFYAGGASDELNTVWQSSGVPVLARPFFNVATGVEDAQLVAYPNVVEGLMVARTHSDLRSAEAVLRGNWSRGTDGRIDVLSGYRYLGFHEGLWLEEQLTIVDPGGNVQVGTQVDLFDRFRTRNDFHGGMLGVLTSLDYGAVSLDIATKLGVGRVWRESVIDGQTHVRTPVGGEAVSPGGLLALPSNMGTYRDSSFALLPELDLKARLMLTDRLSLNVGYQLLFLTNVYRTGQQIDRRIDAHQLPVQLPVNDSTAAAQTHPTPVPTGSTLRAQGLTVGLTFLY